MRGGGDQQFGTVGLDHGGAHIDEFAVDGRRVAFEGRIVAETSAERRPQGVHPEFRAAGHHFFHAGFDCGGVFRPANLVGKGYGVRAEVFGEERLPFGFEDVDDGHVHHVVLVAENFAATSATGFCLDESCPVTQSSSERRCTRS